MPATPAPSTITVLPAPPVIGGGASDAEAMSKPIALIPAIIRPLPPTSSMPTRWILVTMRRLPP